jgi:multidrug transporter EmrE-like cation transporter
MSPFVFIGFSTIFGIVGQLLLKHGMSRMSTVAAERSLILRMVTSPWVVGGLVVYGLGVINWLLALSYLELSYAYPFASLSYIGIIVGSYFVFKERITVMRLAGIAVIIAGVLITSLS